MLCLWLPFTDGVIKNQGLINDEFITSIDPTFSNDGKLGKCLEQGQFDMSAAMTSKILNNQALTICFWIYVNAEEGSKGGTIFGNINTNVEFNNRKFSIFQYPTCNDLHLSWMNDAAKVFIMTPIYKGVLPSYQWTHVTVTYHNPTMTVYINGIKKYTYSGVSNSSSFEYQTRVVWQNAYRKLNDFRIYNECISPRQIKEISKGLVCHYPLGEIDGKIGGRNLLQYSSLVGEQLMCNGITVMNSVTLRQYEEEGYHIITPSEGNQNNGIGFMYNDFTSLNIKQGDTITFSCDIKGTSDSHKPNIIIRFQANSGNWWGNNIANSKPVYFTPSNDNWKRISVTYTIPSDKWTSKTMWLAIHGNYESNLYVRNLKLEKSSTTTPWTPAPEDNTSFYDNAIYDTSGYNNNGSVADSTCPTWSSDTPRYKGSYVFNGNNQYIKFQNPITSSSTDFTISCWVKFDDTTGTSTICTMRTAVGNGIALFKIGNKIRFDDNAQFTFSDYTISANEWTHVVVTRSSSYKNLYINGVLKQTINTVGDMKLISNVGTIGASSQSGDGISNYLNGQLSDFRIYATALSDFNILELYQSSASVDNNGNLMLTGEVIEE
uniref:Concanavalin A-like lectin/glucanase superfamily protein n=1 Tax=Siphoviridae sp. cttFh17 TaxID=2826491 RepID=A0A8S5NIP0_9CAUD|nr:MAG TPA: Concanavalin A-like lectin/glucanase superfamily protein [Siphoviridae sp. cttFh17]